MPIRGPSPIPGRVAQVLKDFLPAELDLIDTEEADGITTPDVPNGNYHEWDRQSIPLYPAVSLNLPGSSPGDIRPAQFGDRADQVHAVDVKFHVTLSVANQQPLRLQKLIHRYITGALRVLCDVKEGLQTSADPTRFAFNTIWRESRYGPEIGQEGGETVRTGTLGITVRRIEAR